MPNKDKGFKDESTPAPYSVIFTCPHPDAVVRIKCMKKHNGPSLCLNKNSNSRELVLGFSCPCGNPCCSLYKPQH